MTEFSLRVYELVRRVPRGRVVSYGGVAALLGRPRAARAVGAALAALPDGTDVPWWRVISGKGEISIRPLDHLPARQRALLRREGVRFDRSGRVDWDRYGWTPEDPPGEDEEQGVGARRRTARPARSAARRRLNAEPADAAETARTRRTGRPR